MRWLFPLKMEKLGVTTDSMSFQKIDITKQVEIPLYPHVGSFGAIRRHDIHKGVDLYCPEGTEVFAVEDGVLCHLRPFTGKCAGCPWWEDTWAVSVAGERGVVVYGEIQWHGFKTIGETVDHLVNKDRDTQRFHFLPKEIKRGDLIGHVKTVLKKDKGRPMSMLHLALHNHGVLSNGVWELGAEKPEGLLDPTGLLVGSEENQL